MLKRWLREPLLHFLLIGAALFILYGLQNDQPADDSRRIIIAESDIDRLSALWEKKWQRLPTREELDGMINAQIREEVLYREALAMGLDQNDSIVRRRLAQKLEFIFSDLASQVQPSDVELSEYLAANSERFETPARISFRQIYLNRDKRGDRTESDAKHLLVELIQPDSTVDILAAGDPFMFGQQHENLTEHNVARLFGKNFSGKLFKLPAGGWQGPVLSGYGLHLVQINGKATASMPELSAVRNKVLNEWLALQRRTMNEAFYQSLLTRYEIVVEDISARKNVASTTVSVDKQ